MEGLKKLENKTFEELQAIADKGNLTIVTVKTGYLLINFTTNEVITWDVLTSLEEVEDWLSELEKNY